ncbi:unnamed protein product [Phytophthora fragariaefolia]|uniref:Unnamed protein product n=1 Tax=Phytophthora fragariaefolia TaxID=1490495 RepID=A0A9W6U241_9STRA|nr:unnamed protein product [Phytophthora fragariaefolia]
MYMYVMHPVIYGTCILLLHLQTVDWYSKLQYQLQRPSRTGYNERWVVLTLLVLTHISQCQQPISTSASKYIMNLRSLVFTALAATIFSSVEAVSIDHDKVQPFAQPEPVTISEKAAVKHKPILQIVDGCHPYPAVNTAGETSAGLKASGKEDGQCKGSDLGSQVYGRAVWYKDLWAIMYAWYFPKDRYQYGFRRDGHRHKWVNAVVWLDNPALEKPKIVAVSTWNLKGGPILSYEPYTEAYTGTKLLHTLLPIAIRNVGEVQELIMWEQLSEPARAALSETDFGEKTKVPFIDANLNTSLEEARPFL